MNAADSRRRGFQWGMAVGVGLRLLGAPVGEAAANALTPADSPGPAASTPLSVPGETLFASDRVYRLELVLSVEDVDRLRRDGRQDVPAVVIEDDRQRYADVRVHLKGTSSYQGIDAKPSLTLKFGGSSGGLRFHGLRKLHLNNSAEDPSYFNEYAGSELFRAAGVPTPRVTHALVTLNGRRLGLYVLKEGFAEEFLGLHFRNVRGTLYEPGPGHDVDERMEREAGEGPDDGRDLAVLAAAAHEPDLTQRWVRLGDVLDRDRFLSFMALEVMVCHRDGYCLARNNFRLYHDPEVGQWVFLPHGMDQLFGLADATLQPHMQGLVARVMLEIPEGRRAYRERLARLVNGGFAVATLERAADDWVRRARQVLTRREARELGREVAAVKKRISLRKQYLESASQEGEAEPLNFAKGAVPLTGWQAVNPPAGGRIERRPTPDGQEAFYIRAGPMTSASWRTRVLLGKGSYRFRAVATMRGVVGFAFGNNQGVGLRVVGGSPVAPYALVGDHPEIPLERGFEVEAEREVELICELRAQAGEVWFILNSLRLEAQDS